MCIFITGCGNKSGKTVLKFSTWGSASEMAIIKTIVADYEQKNPDIKIEIMHIPQDYFKKVHLLFASNLAPDILLINNLNIPFYSNHLCKLTDLLNKSEYYSQAIDGMSYDGELYAVPRDVSTLVIYYNKSLFDKYGVKYPQKNWTMHDLLSISKKLTGENRWGISYEENVFYLSPYVNYNGGEILEESKNTEKGIEQYKALPYKFKSAPTPSQTGSKTLAQMFLEGKIAMHLSGRWLVPKYRECAQFQWDVINFPHGSVTSDTSGWAVSKQSKHKAESIKFVKYLSGKESISKMTSDGLIVPARKDVAESQIFLKGKPNHSEVFIESVLSSKATKVSKDYAKKIDKLNDKIFSGHN